MTVKLVEKLDIGLERRKRNYFIVAKTKVFRTTRFCIVLCLCHVAKCTQYTTVFVWFTWCPLKWKQHTQTSISRGNDGKDRLYDTYLAQIFQHLSSSNRYSTHPNSPVMVLVSFIMGSIYASL